MYTRITTNSFNTSLASINTLPLSGGGVGFDMLEEINPQIFKENMLESHETKPDLLPLTIVKD